MPDTNGKLQLQDFDGALVVRGFDGFAQADRYQMINLGYRYVARKFPHTWEETSQTYTILPGQYTVIGMRQGSPLTPKSIRAVRINTDPYRNKLEPEDLDRFLKKWFDLDLSNSQNRGTPAKYIIFDQNLYVLPPPQVTMTFEIFYYQFLPDMTLPTDITVMPQVFDELIIDAALVRCHRRAHELTLAGEAQARVQEGIDDLLVNDIFQEEELQERTLPDDQWF